MNTMKRILATLLATAMLATSAWATTEETITEPSLSETYVVEAGIMQGYGDGQFYGEDTVTYAQLVQTLYNLQGNPAVAEEAVFEGWYNDAAVWAMDAKLVSGDVTDEALTSEAVREEIAAVLCAYADLVGLTFQSDDLSAYTDADTIAEENLVAMKLAVGTGLLTAVEDGVLAPQGTLTRSQLADALYAISLKTVTYESDKRPLLLQGAMGIETTTMMEALEDTTEYTLGQYVYVAGTYCDYPVVVSRTEVGEANAGASTALAMEFFNPVAVINQGTSGGHDPELHTFDIVLGEQTFDGSAWKTVASAEGEGVDYTAFEMIGVASYDPENDTEAFTKKVYFDADETLLNCAIAVMDQYEAGTVVVGTINSSDSWNNQVDRMLYFYETYGSSAEEMESNPVAQICDTYDVPYLAARILSNTGIYGEDFDWMTGAACQEYVLMIAEEYITTYLATADESVTAYTETSIYTQSYDKTLQPILLQGAMGIETTTMIDALENPVAYRLGEWDFVAGDYMGYPVVVCRTEQGLSNTGAVTALAMEFFNPCAVINQGTSGGHDPELHTFDIVLGTYTQTYSSWKTVASAEGEGVDYTAFEMLGTQSYNVETGAFEDKLTNEGDAGLLAAALSVAEDYAEGTVVEGTISSSNEWNNQIDRMLYLNETYNSSCEEMETNAAADLCATYNVPFLGIRILSNTGLYGEDFNWLTGAACQNYVLSVTEAYIATLG